MAYNFFQEHETNAELPGYSQKTIWGLHFLRFALNLVAFIPIVLGLLA